jgi:hypothetical protein
MFSPYSVSTTDQSTPDINTLAMQSLLSPNASEENEMTAKRLRAADTPYLSIWSNDLLSCTMDVCHSITLRSAWFGLVCLYVCNHVAPRRDGVVFAMYVPTLLFMSAQRDNFVQERGGSP